jgi:hypothetical protein
MKHNYQQHQFNHNNQDQYHPAVLRGHNSHRDQYNLLGHNNHKGRNHLDQLILVINLRKSWGRLQDLHKL